MLDFQTTLKMRVEEDEHSHFLYLDPTTPPRYLYAGKMYQVGVGSGAQHLAIATPNGKVVVVDIQEIMVAALRLAGCEVARK